MKGPKLAQKPIFTNMFIINALILQLLVWIYMQMNENLSGEVGL